MIMKKLIFSLLLSLTTVVSFTSAAFAQDISGTYTGTLKAENGEGQGGSGSIVLKQDGQTLTVDGPQAKMLGHFQLLHCLGQGAFGAVW